jgi:hypothetical protein
MVSISGVADSGARLAADITAEHGTDGASSGNGASKIALQSKVMHFSSIIQALYYETFPFPKPVSNETCLIHKLSASPNSAKH